MGKIKLLDKTVAGMIAAGEVVERPASVAKELLENAIDAGSTHITVEIKGGGIAYLRVTDNGCGMTMEDAKLSLLRHATSKISDAVDLEAIRTLGFRGEALASISAVSKMEIYTKAAEEELGTHLVSRDDTIVECGEAGCPDGTTIIVRDLFYSTPARMKFLKKDYTEAGYIADMINRLALSHPHISFKFINNGKEMLFTAGDNILSNCVFSVYGRDVQKAMVEVDFSDLHIRVHGLCGKAEISRPNRNMQNFFINGRYIKSPLISRAVEEAYKNELMVGKFPACVLHIELNPASVDINVHPTKLEAKFANEKDVYHCVYWAVKNALYRRTDIPEVEEKQPMRVPELAEKTVVQKVPYNTTMREEPMRPLWKKQEDEPPAPAEQFKVTQLVPPQVKTGENGTVLPEQAGPAATESVPNPEIQKDSLPEECSDKRDKPFEINLAEPPEYRICGQVFQTYIIVEKDGKMLMVDQHAAHERLRYEELLRQYQNRQIASQALLFPTVVKLTGAEMAAYRENEEQMNRLGFFVEEFGEDSVIIRNTPEDLPEDELKSLLVEIIGMFADKRKNVGDDIVSKMLYRISCRGAIKANHTLHGPEMKALLDAVFSLEGINTCPHGRPITIAFTKEFIEKQFKRIV